MLRVHSKRKKNLHNKEETKKIGQTKKPKWRGRAEFILYILDTIAYTLHTMQ